MAQRMNPATPHMSAYGSPIRPLRSGVSAVAIGSLCAPCSGAADITIVRPQPEFVKKKAAARSNPERGLGSAVARAGIARHG
jgi:hypothetical protein